MEPILQHDASDFDCQFTEAEVGALGDLSGLRVLHLVSGLPFESFALVALGPSEVVVMDADTTDQNLVLTPGLIEIGEALATERNLPVSFVATGLAETSDAERDNAFDVVYAGPTTLAWTENLGDWAVDVAEALVPGGLLVLYDEHPAGRAAEPVPADLEEAGEDSGFPVDEEWTLEELRAELVANGLTVERLESLYGEQRFLTTLDTLEDPGDAPSAFLLVARKP